MTHLSWLAWSLVATLVLTGLLTSAARLGWTRLSIVYLLGMIVTTGRERARVVGTLMHLVSGCLFAVGYRALLVS